MQNISLCSHKSSLKDTTKVDLQREERSFTKSTYAIGESCPTLYLLNGELTGRIGAGDVVPASGSMLNGGGSFMLTYVMPDLRDGDKVGELA